MALRFKKIEILISEREEVFLRSIHDEMNTNHGRVDNFLKDTIDALDNDHQVIITDVDPRLLKKEKRMDEIADVDEQKNKINDAYAKKGV